MELQPLHGAHTATPSQVVPQEVESPPIQAVNNISTPTSTTIIQPATEPINPSQPTTPTQPTHPVTSPQDPETVSLLASSNSLVEDTTPHNSISPTPPTGSYQSPVFQQDPSLDNHNQTRKRQISFVWSLKSLIFLIVVYILTLSLIFTANFLSGPLAHLGVTYGFLVLNIVALANNFAFMASGDKAWEGLQFGPLMRKAQELKTFLALSSSSGMGGWSAILFEGVRSWLNAMIKKTSATVPGGSWKSPPRLWSLGRIIFWLAIQFPGIIFLTQVNTTTSYPPLQWKPITGGIGVFDPSLPLDSVFEAPLYNGLVLNMLRDATITIAVTPVHNDCARSTTCVSYIIPGGLTRVTPWPFKSQLDASFGVYLTKGTPVYQLDFWDAPSGIAWASSDCRIYGSNTFALQLCVSAQDGDTIVAGWRGCSSVVTASGDCARPGSWEAETMWSTWIAIYRRTATVAADRKTGLLLAVSDLSDAIVQKNIIGNFSVAINQTLHPWTGTAPTFQCADDGPDMQVTAWLTSLLLTAANNTSISTTRDTLRNLFMTPLYTYDPMKFLTTNQSYEDTVWPDVATENKIYGSFARKLDHLTISEWTAITYAVSAGFLLVLVVAARLLSLKQVQPASKFPIVDFLMLKNSVLIDKRQAGGTNSEITMLDVFRGCEVGNDNQILCSVAAVELRPKTL